VIERKMVIPNRAGLHARAAALLVKEANRFRCRVDLSRAGETVNAKSIMGVMMLAASQGTAVTLRCDGPDEAEAAAAIEKLIAAGFGEDK
jgi:phosphocarrier protein